MWRRAQRKSATAGGVAGVQHPGRITLRFGGTLAEARSGKCHAADPADGAESAGNFARSA